MARSILGVVVVSVALTRPIAADMLSVTTIVHGDRPNESLQVQLSAKRVDGSGTPLERTISVPGTSVIDVPKGNWELSMQPAGYWAAPSVVSTGVPASLDLWPAGMLHGTIEAGKGIRAQELRVSFAPAVERIGNEHLPSGESACTVDDDHWRCLLPAGRFDLRFLSRGFAAEFRWNQEVRAHKETGVGLLALRRGASLIGFVSAARGVKVEMKNVVIAARPRGVSGQTRRSYTSAPNARGFFQIAGLPAGEYGIQAEAKGLRSEDRVITVLEDRNAELRSALFLDTPKRIFLTITSSASSAEDPWHLRLYREVDAGKVDEVLTAVTDPQGRWEGEVFEPGNYIVHIGRADQSMWKSSRFAVSGTDTYLDVAIPVVKVVGTVKIGDRPLGDARLIFGSQRGSGELALKTDDDGAFSGVMPVPDEKENAWKIEIRSDDPQVARTVVYEPQGDDDERRFDIVLPATLVRGRVVNEDGSAASGAWVALQADNVFEQTATAEDGGFELVGFEPGRYRIQAEMFQRRSDVLEISAGDGDSAPIEIVLRDDVIVRGRIRSRATTAVEAKLMALPLDVRDSFVPRATTDSQGLFELTLPPLTRIFDLVVQAPGFALGIGRVQIQDNKMLTITVDQIAGSLALELPTGVDAILRHDGGEYPARWLTERVGGSIEGRDGWTIARISNVEPGAYSLCGNGQCRSGVVAPNGSLTLSLR